MNEQPALGVITHEASARRTDYLYRISLKCLVRDAQGNILVVKESGRDSWDLPGGGMDHGEGLKRSLAREMKEEVSLEGDFHHQIIAVEEPSYLQAHDFWQVRLIFNVSPQNMQFSAGVDCDEIAFIDPLTFRDSHSEVERRIYTYSQLAIS